MATARGGLIVAALSALGACSTGPDVERALGTSPRDARLALELAAASGPVRGRVQGQPVAAEAARVAEAEARVLALMADAVAALPVTFTADPTTPASPALVVTFGALPGTTPCREPQALADPLHVVAAFCDDRLAIGAVSGTASSDDDAARAQLLRRLSRGLFPNLYAERYGIGGGPFPRDTGIGHGSRQW